MTTQTPTAPSKPKQRRRRDFNALPEMQPEACEFSADPLLTDPLSVMHLIKEHLSGGAPGTVGDLWDRTSARLDCSKVEGRKRTPGDWGLLYTAGFVLSRQAEMMSFWDNQLWSPIWAEAGFEPDKDGSHRRSYSTMWRRFTELEADECIAAVEEAADELIQLAMSKEPRIGRDVYVDGTNTHSRARLHHDCPDAEKCKAAGRATDTVEPASAELVRERRKKEAELPLDEAEKARKDDPKPAQVLDGDRYAKYIWIGDHRYGVLDADVGFRVYRSKGGKVKKAWVGGHDVVAIDGFLGATLANIHAPADATEHKLYEPLMERVLNATGGVMPEAVAGDRGYSVEEIFRWNTERGIASVIPFRSPGSKVAREDIRNVAFDEHGVARCPHCGGPGKQFPGVRFTKAGTPRIRFRCADANTVACMTHTWSLAPGDYKHGFRTLVPLSRLSPRYHAMKAASLHMEKSHRERRKRQWVDGADETCKIKRFGLAAHRLRSAVARFLDWFRLCLRHGWLPGYSGKINTRELRQRSGEDRRLTLYRSRRWQGLDLPYGPAAHALRLALDPGVPPPRPSPKKKPGG